MKRNDELVMAYLRRLLTSREKYEDLREDLEDYFTAVHEAVDALNEAIDELHDRLEEALARDGHDDE